MKEKNLVFKRITSKEEANNLLGDIVESELSVNKMYEVILKNARPSSELSRLKEFRVAHKKALEFWQSTDTIDKAQFGRFSKVWHKIHRSVSKTKDFQDNTDALNIIKRPEELSLKHYENALKKAPLKSDEQIKIKRSIIPNQKRHINILRAILKAM